MICWSQRPLSMVVNVSQKAKPTPVGGRIWNLNLDQIESHSGRILQKVYANVNELGTSTYAFAPKTVLYSKLRPYLNKVVVADEAGVATTELVPIRCNPDEVLPEYLAYFLRSPDFLKFATTVVAGAKMPRMVMSEFWNFKVPLPPIPEQRRIAAILDQADTLRAKRREALAQLDSLTQAIFIDMFGDPATNPKNWTIKELGTVCNFVNGGTPSKSNPEYFKGDIPWISSADIVDSKMNEARYFLTEEAISNSATNLVPAETILLVTRTGVGKVVITNTSLCFSQDITAVLPDEKLINKIYLCVYLKHNESYFQSMARGATIKGITREIIERLQLPVPPIEQQNKFASCAKSIEKLRAVEECSLLNTNSLFSSLQRRAFRGEL